MKGKLRNTLEKIILIVGPLGVSGVGLNYTIRYAMEGKYLETFVGALCTLVNAYASGVHSERLLTKEK